MSFSNRGRFHQHVRFLRRQFLQDGELPFTDVLSEGVVTQALKALNVAWRDRVYSPLVTLWIFLGQVLSRDHSCRAAVARLIAHRVSRVQRPCSAETGAYCQARKRLPEEFFAEVARKTGQALDEGAHGRWLWKGRRVLAYDGSTVSMPDTPENQQAYPQPPQQQPGLGFPLARMAAFFSLSCGAVLDLAICSNAGKGHSELGMLRRLWDLLRPGDIMLADRYMCAWHEIWTHILAYILIRTIIAQAANKHRLEPPTISFKGAVQTLEAFQPMIATQGDCSSTHRRSLYDQLLDAVATHRVADRPDRFEPRQRKRRQKKYDRMMKPRNQLKREMLKGVR